MINKANLLRSALDRPGLIRVMGAHNGISAKLAERNGFDAIWASSLEISASFGVPDASILTMSEFLSTAQTMNDVTSIPIIADCDSGFGDASIVGHMTHKYEAAGIAAVCIEDKPFPKMNSFVESCQKLLPVDQFVEKIQAATAARSTPDMVVIARTEALVVGCGVSEALLRARAYADAGADAILVHSKQRTADEVIDFARRWDRPIPLVAIPTTYYHTPAVDLEREGFKVVIYANHAMRAAIRAMAETMSAIQADGSTRDVERTIASLDELFDLQGLDRVIAVRQ